MAVVSILLLVAEWLIPLLTDYQSSNPAQRWIALAIAVVSAAYSIGRSWVKAAAIKTDSPPMGGSLLPK